MKKIHPYENVLSDGAYKNLHYMRGGWTMLEMVVTTSIIAVLAALTIPAIQSARESARVMQVKNSMGQLTKAQHMFHDNHQHFAPAVGKPIVAEGAAHDGEVLEMVTWPVNLRPYVQSKTPYDTYHTPYFQTQETYDAKLPLLHPNTPGGTNVMAVVGNVAPADIAQINANNLQPHFFTDPQAAMNGAMPVEPYGAPTRIADFTDGTSNTLMFVESNLTPTLPNPNTFPIPADEVRRYWSPFYGAAYLSLSGEIAVTGSNGWSQVVNPGSQRGTGVVAAKADGSVTTISQNIDGKVLRAMATRAGQESEQAP